MRPNRDGESSSSIDSETPESGVASGPYPGLYWPYWTGVALPLPYWTGVALPLAGDGIRRPCLMTVLGRGGASCL